MKQPIWKIWLSHFTELVIDTASTDLNPDLQLGLKNGRYCLSTPHAIYSYGDLYGNFSKSFNKINISDKDIYDVLVLGFGLGSIPIILEKNFYKKCSYAGVEADETIAWWASKYVLGDLKSPVQMHITDAALFVETCSEKFDLIAMDIFVDNEIPSEFEEVTFLKKLKALLRKNGILMYNRLALRAIDKERTSEFFKHEFKTVFPKGRYLDLGGNWMLLNH